MEGEFARTLARSWNILKSRAINLVHRFDPDPRRFGNYELVMPHQVSTAKPVPSHIPRPPYVGKDDEDVPPSIQMKTRQQIEAMRSSCKLAKAVLNSLRDTVRVGMTTEELDEIAQDLIESKGAYPSPLHYMKFPRSICTSVNNVIIHGIPDNRTLKNGDIITIDVSVYFKGYHGDCSETVLLGDVDKAGIHLVNSTRDALYAGIKCCGPKVPFIKIAHEVTKLATERGLVVIPCVAGHGIGQCFHERPTIWHQWPEDAEDVNENDVMLPGMIFTIEPALGEGTEETEMWPDGWAVATSDGSRAAQMEHTILITNKGHEILTV